MRLEALACVKLRDSINGYSGTQQLLSLALPLWAGKQLLLLVLLLLLLLLPLAAFVRAWAWAMMLVAHVCA